jgi:hypothetical protein
MSGQILNTLLHSFPQIGSVKQWKIPQHRRSQRGPLANRPTHRHPRTICQIHWQSLVHFACKCNPEKWLMNNRWNFASNSQTEID